MIVDCLDNASRRMSEYGDPAGLWELRELITSFIGPARGMAVTPEQLLMVAGCQHGLSLAAHLFVATKTLVVVGRRSTAARCFYLKAMGEKSFRYPPIKTELM